MEALKFSCKNCSKTIVVRWLKCGEQVLCRQCGTQNVVPADADAATAADVAEMETAPPPDSKADKPHTARAPDSSLPAIGQALVAANVVLLALVLYSVAALPVLEGMMMSRGYPGTPVTPIAWLLSAAVVVGMFALARSYRRSRKAATVACGTLLVTNLLNIIGFIGQGEHTPQSILFSVMHLIAGGAFIVYYFVSRREFTR